MDSRKIDAYELTDAQKNHAYKMTGAQKRKIDAYKMTGAQKSHEYEMTDAQKNHEYEMTGAQKKKSDEYEMTDAQKIDSYEMTDAQKSHEYEMTGAQKKNDAYKMTGAQKSHEYEMTGAQKKIDAYKMKGSQKTREYNLSGAQKIDEKSSCVKVRKNDGVEIIHECQRKRTCRDVDVKPVVQDLMDDDRVLVESGIRKTETQSHSHPISTMVHIMRRRQSTSGTTQTSTAHLRRQRIPSDTMRLSHAERYGGHWWIESVQHVCENISQLLTDSYATTLAVKILNFPGFSDIILQCDFERSFTKWTDSVKSKRTERTVIRSSPRRSHQSNGGVENYQKQLQRQVRTMLAAIQEHTKYRRSADNALMRWIVRHAAWLIPRFRGSEIQSPFHRAMGGPYRAKLVEFGETVLAHLPEVKRDLETQHQNWQTDGNLACGLGKSDLTDEHHVRTDDGVVYARSVRRLAENS